MHVYIVYIYIQFREKGVGSTRTRASEREPSLWATTRSCGMLSSTCSRGYGGEVMDTTLQVIDRLRTRP